LLLTTVFAGGVETTVTGVATVIVCGDGVRVLRSRLAVDQCADHDLEQFNGA
jgi:hypothetical protein